VQAAMIRRLHSTVVGLRGDLRGNRALANQVLASVRAVETRVDAIEDQQMSKASTDRQRLDTAVARLRWVVIAVLVVMITGLAGIGAEFGWQNDRVHQLAARLDGLEARLGVKFDAMNAMLDPTNEKLDAINAKLDAANTKLDAANTKLDAANTKFDAISHRLGAEFRAEIASQTSALAKSIAAARGTAPPTWAPAQLPFGPVPGYVLPPPPRSRP
jgi:uncharacterized protein HemX